MIRVLKGSKKRCSGLTRDDVDVLSRSLGEGSLINGLEASLPTVVKPSSEFDFRCGTSSKVCCTRVASVARVTSSVSSISSISSVASVASIASVSIAAGVTSAVPVASVNAAGESLSGSRGARRNTSRSRSRSSAGNHIALVVDRSNAVKILLGE